MPASAAALHWRVAMTGCVSCAFVAFIFRFRNQVIHKKRRLHCDIFILAFRNPCSLHRYVAAWKITYIRCRPVCNRIDSMLIFGTEIRVCHRGRAARGVVMTLARADYAPARSPRMARCLCNISRVVSVIAEFIFSLDGCLIRLRKIIRMRLK